MATDTPESTYSPDTDAVHHPLGGGMLIHVPASLTVIGVPDPSKRVAFRVEMVAGVLRPTAITVSSDDLDEITAVDLRAVNVKTLWRNAIVRHIVYKRENAEATGFVDSPVQLPDDVLERMRLRGPVTETLNYVSDMYALATKLGLPPALYVQESFKGEGLEPIPRTTASKWIKKARDRGILGDPMLGDEGRILLPRLGY